MGEAKRGRTRAQKIAPDVEAAIKAMPPAQFKKVVCIGMPGTTQERVTVQVINKGRAETFDIVLLSALEVDAIERTFARPAPPLKDGKLDYNDLEYKAADESVLRRREAARVGRAIQLAEPATFAAPELKDVTEATFDYFDEHALSNVARQLRVASTTTPELREGIKAVLRPFVSTVKGGRGPA